MGRTVEFGDTEFILDFKGLLSFFTLKRKLIIPYKTIQSVSVYHYDAPKWMLRMPGTSIKALNIYEGSFKYLDAWYFLSFEKRTPVVIIRLAGHEKYKYVIFQIDKPTAVASALRERVKDFHSARSI